MRYWLRARKPQRRRLLRRSLGYRRESTIPAQTTMGPHSPVYYAVGVVSAVASARKPAWYQALPAFTTLLG